MRFPARCAINKVQPKGFVLIEKGTITAANDALLVEIPFEGDGPERAAIESREFAHCLKGRGVRNPIARLDYQDDKLTAVAGDGSRLTLEQQTTMPYPRAGALEEPEAFHTVRFNAHLLAQAAAAMGTDVVEIRIPHGEYLVTRPLVVRPCDGGRDGSTPLKGAKAILGVHT